MNRDFKKEIRGKRSKFCLLEPLISPRRVIMDHPQEEEEEDRAEDEGEVAEEDDSPRMTEMKKRKSRLTSQRLIATILKRWVTLPMIVIQTQRRKGKRRRQMSMRAEEESALMMVVSDECGELLLQGMNDPHNNCMWYLDTRARSHMIGKKAFFHKIDENMKGRVKFGDGSTIPNCEGKGNISITLKNGKILIIQNVLYLLDLKTNILSLGKLDDQGCKTSLSNGFLTVHDKAGRLLTKTKKTLGNMYKMKIDINERCNLIKEEASEAWLWHKRLYH